MSHFSEMSLRTESLDSFNPNIARKEPLIFPASAKRAKIAQSFAGLPPEPEDAQLTGATRSLFRRLLALNLRKHIVPASSSVPADAKIA